MTPPLCVAPTRSRRGRLPPKAGAALAAVVMRPSRPRLSNSENLEAGAPLRWGDDPLGDLGGGEATAR